MNTGFLPIKYQKRHIVLATSKELKVRNHSFEDVKFADFCNALFAVKSKPRNRPVLPSKCEPIFVPEPNRKITTTRVFQKINGILNKNTAIVADVGDSLFGALDITVHDSHHFISDAFYTSMGFAVPGALGIQAANSDLRPIVIVGDGAFQMTGMEFSTLCRQHALNGKDNTAPIVIILNNHGYGTERLMIDGEFNNIPDWNYEKIPSIIGAGVGYKVNTEDELHNAMTRALQGNEPTIINICLDKNDHTPALKRMFANVAKRCLSN